PPARRPATTTRGARRGVPLGVLGALLGVSAIVTLVLVLSSSGGSGTHPSSGAAAVSGDVVSKHGIHWHPELAIYIHGQKQTIPANLGIGRSYSTNKWYDPMMQMTDVHTHDTSG